MTRDTAPPVATCDSSALMRNVEFGRKHKITGTPTLLAQDGKRVPGAIPVAQIEQLISGKP
jgi:thiol:disulfide interchange protein DsbC